MINYTPAITMVLIIVLILSCSEQIEAFVSKSAVCAYDGRCYKVANKYHGTDQASKILADLNVFGVNVMRHLRDKYIFGTPPEELNERRRFKTKAGHVKFLLENYNPDNIIENAPKTSVNTSYVMDKGKIFAICLREKASGKNEFHKMNELEFVVLHEMAHMANYTTGHETDFWTVFKFLVKEAEMAGLHTPINYEHNPIVYCSLPIDYNPYYDNTLIDL